MNIRRANLRRALSVLALLPLLGAPLAAQETGSVAGRVTAATGQPLDGAQVEVVGTNRGGLTNAEGRYLVTGLQPGPARVRVVSLGYAQQTQDVNIVAGQAVGADFVLEQSAVALDAIVVSATGRQQQRREIGSSVGVIDVEEVELAPVHSFSQLIQGRSAGVSVLPAGGTAGSGSRIRIRGSNSAFLSNSPLLIVDGIRVDDNPRSYELFTGGQEASRIDDLNPEDIESIEILRGPSAAALYGTAAANGVIQITTKRGRAGDARWQFWAEGSTQDKHFDFPDNYWARSASGSRCDLLAQAAGSCTASELVTFNPLETEETSLLRDGWGQKYGMSVSGGNERATYYVSGEWDDVTGNVVENSAETFSLRANLTGEVKENLRIGAKAGYLDSEVQFPQNDNSGIGILTNALTGPPVGFFRDDWDGYGLPPEYLTAWDQFQDVQRTTLSGNADWQPLDWLSLNAVAGVDDVNRHDNDLLPPNILELFGPPFSIGLRESIRYNIVNYTASAGGTAEWAYGDDFTFETGLGTQYYQDRTDAVYAAGQGLTPGTGSLAGASSGFETSEINTENITLGAYATQRVSFRERLFLNGAVRGDKNSAFGTNLGWIWYPSVSASWVASDEPFFPDTDWLSQLRVRASWGQSGLRPSFRDAILFFDGVTASTLEGEIPGFVVNGAGNPDLEPQRSTEWEVGFEAGLLDDRLGLELTYYDKKSEDDIVDQPLPPSAGGSEERKANLGLMTNKGVEYRVSLDALRRPGLTWNVQLLGSYNDNELASLGGEPQIFFGRLGATQTFAEGHPAGAYWQQPILGFADANGDGIIEESEVQIGEDAGFVGKVFPDTELAFSTTVTVGDWLSLFGMLDFKGGHHLLNTTEWSRCEGTQSVCAARHDADAALADQAAAVAYIKEGTLAGYIEPADYWKLREVSATLHVPQRFASYIAGRDLSLTLAGRNLFTWTDFSGLDPEVNGFGQSNFGSEEDFTIPPYRIWTARINIAF